MKKRNTHSMIRRRSGFTLAEILIAMAVFLIGFVAVVSLFPAAAILQKQTVDDVRTEQVGINVAAMLKAKPYIEGDIPAQLDPTTSDPTGADADKVLRFAQTGTVANGYFLGGWTLADRSLPLLTPNPFDADYYWAPMIRYDSASGVWSVYAFIMKRNPSVTYTFGANSPNSNDPQGIPHLNLDSTAAKTDTSTFTVTSASTKYKPGDWVLDNNGVIYQIKDADYTASTIEVNSFIPESPSAPNQLFYAHPGDGNRSPLVKIIQIVGTEAVQP